MINNNNLFHDTCRIMFIKMTKNMNEVLVQSSQNGTIGQNARHSFFAQRA